MSIETGFVKFNPMASPLLPKSSFADSPLPDLEQEIEIVVSDLLTDDYFQTLQKMFLDGLVEDFSYRLLRRNGQGLTEIKIIFKQDYFEFIAAKLEPIISKYRFAR